MPNAADLIQPDPDLETPNVQAAVVKRAPADLTDTLAVSIPSFDPLKLEEVHFWMPRGDVLPAEGDAALIAYAEDGEPWLVGFSSPSGVAHAAGGVWGYKVPETVYAIVAEGQYLILPPDGIEIDGVLDFDGRVIELEEILNP